MAGRQLVFSGRVAVVTGAGGGLGKEYALLLAERGASVVVNDLGGSRSGEGKNVSAADQVVSEIQKKGGKAVADYNSVEEGEKIIATALKNFGKIDILINNAGILKDKSFLKLSKDEWDAVHRVHLRGSFLVSKAAWPHFREQKYGRIIMTSSGAGVFGNFGQANYASAKLGLIGLSNVLAIEGAKYGIHCNTIIPVAASRLTEDVIPQELFKRLKPSLVSPVVTWLCHESCTENGGVFGAEGGWIGKYHWNRSVGKGFVSDTLTPETVRDHWDEATDMEGAVSPQNIQEHTSLVMEALSGSENLPKRPGASRTADKEKSSGIYHYDQDSAILYALGVGASVQDPASLKFLYENHSDFSILPSFGVVPAMAALFNSPALSETMQKLNIDLTKILHGEQYLEILKLFPPEGTLTSVAKVVDTLDKGSGAAVIADVDTFDEKGEKVAYSQWNVFAVGAGNFGGKRKSDKAIDIVPAPKRKPDATIRELTMPDQAALYRLMGDKNPLHIDSNFSALGGFPQPIMHGLCLLGYATRHVLKQFANNDVRKFKAVKTRFSGPVIPGQEIATDMWQEGNRIFFQTYVPGMDKPVLSGGYMDLTSVESAGVPANRNDSLSSSVPKKNPSRHLKSDLVFTEVAERMKKNPAIASDIRAVFQWNIQKDGRPANQWTLDLTSGSGKVYRGTPKDGRPNVTITAEDDDLFNIAVGKLDPHRAFISGRLKIAGNALLTRKLQPLFKDSTPVGIPAAPTVIAAPASSNEDPPRGSRKVLRSDKVFASIAKKVERKPDLAASVKTVFLFTINKDGKFASNWTLDLKNGKGSLYEGTAKDVKPDCTLVMEDDVMADIYEGKQDPQKAFMTGKMRIRGNVLASQKLQEIWDDDSGEDERDPWAETGTETGGSAAPSNDLPSEPPTGVKADFVFRIFAERLMEEPDITKKMNVIYHWTVLQNGKKASEWTVDLKHGTGAIFKGPPEGLKPDCVITSEDEDVIKLMLGKLNPQRAFMMGRLKIRGNIMLTQKLNQLWQEVQKSGRAVELPLLAPILADETPLNAELKSEMIVLDLAKRIARMPDLASKVQNIYEFVITKNGKEVSHWTFDLKKGKGSVYRGVPKGEKAACGLTMDDDDFAGWCTGRVTPQQVVSSGRGKSSGDINLSVKLNELFRPKSKL